MIQARSREGPNNVTVVGGSGRDKTSWLSSAHICLHLLPF